MTQHEMRLHPGPFEKIKSGAKNIELRLYDEKRQQIKVGDTILFINRGDDDTMICRVIGLCIFENFAELVAAVGAKPCGWDKDTPPTDPDADMEAYYPKTDIQKYGALGIVLKVL